MVVREKKKPVIDPYGDSFAGRLARWVDNAIYLAFPKWGASRQHLRLRNALVHSRADKLGVSWTRPNETRNWLATGYSIDRVMYNDIRDLQDRCAELYRTNDIAHAAVEARVANEIETGITPQSRIIDNTQANDALEFLFHKWSKYGVDVTRTMSFWEFERLIDRSLAIFGEAIIVLSDTPSPSGITTTLELISPERLSPPPGQEVDDLNRLGVQLNPAGQVIGYWIRTQHPRELVKNFEYKWEYYPRFDDRGQPRVIHIYENVFANQHRGIPWLAPGMDRINDLDKWWEAELVAKQIEACFALIFSGGEYSGSGYDRAKAEADGYDPRGNQLEELQPGLVHYANEGEDVTTVDPQRPGATFAPFVELTLRSISSTLNIPYEILAKNFFRTTFSSGQLAMLDGRKGFKTRRQLIVDKGLVPIWGRFVDDAVFYNEAQGTIDITQYVVDKDKYCQSLWTAPGWGFINPKDDVKATNEAIDGDITTYATAYAEKGEDSETQLRVRHEEKREQMRRDVELRKEQWQLEEDYGLPHAEEAGQPQEDEEPDDGDDSTSEVSEETENEPVAAG